MPAPAIRRPAAPATRKPSAPSSTIVSHAILPTRSTTPAAKNSPATPVSPSSIEMGEFILLYGAPGSGKSTFSSQFPAPHFVCTADDPGAIILKKHKLLAATVPITVLEPLWDDASIPKKRDHPGFLQCLDLMDKFVKGGHPHRTLVFDCGTGLQSIIFQHCISLDYDGDASARSEFFGWQKGYEVAATRYWQAEFLTRCTRLVEAGYNVLLNCHSTQATIPNPYGPDFSEFRPSLQYSKSATCFLGCVQKSAHAILFMTDYKEYGKADTKKHSRTIVQSQSRFIGTYAEPWFMAKNWWGLIAHIDQGKTPADTWKNFAKVVTIR